MAISYPFRVSVPQREEEVIDTGLSIFLLRVCTLGLGEEGANVVNKSFTMKL